MKYTIIWMIGLGWMLAAVTGLAKSTDETSRAAASTSAKHIPPKIEAGTQTLLVFPSYPARVPFTEAQLSLFRGSLSETDRLGIIIADRKEHILSLDEKKQKEVTSAQIVSAFEKGAASVMDAVDTDESTVPAITLESVLRGAVAQVSDLDGMVKAVVLVLEKPLAVDSAAIKDTATESNTLLSLLTLNNVILYTVFAPDVSMPQAEQLSVESGGKNLFLSTRTSLNDALYTAYDSILLRTIQLAPQQALYESDKVCPETDEKVVAAVPVDSEVGGWVIALLVLLTVAVAAVLTVCVFIWRKLSTPVSAAVVSGSKKDETQSSSFSKLTIGLNRVRNSFAETESKLHALSADLDDFGSDNWELQKKIISAYAELARELFLVYDHLALKRESELTEGDRMLKRKVEQLLEAVDVEELNPEVGTKFHSKYHIHAGERYSDEQAGTVLEVVRKGYQRKGFVTDEPFVIRQAEVIVSAGEQQGDKRNE